MKVALFTNSYLPYLSGITISVKTLKDELQALGHTVLVVGPSYPGHKDSDPKILHLPSFPAGYPGYRLAFPFSPSVLSRLWKEKIDIIHAHQPFGVGIAARFLAKILGIPFVYSFHTLFSRYVHNVPLLPQNLSRFAVSNYVAFFCRQADAVIVPSEMVRRLLALRKLPVPVYVIPTGIKLDRIKERKALGGQREEVRKKLGLASEAFILLYAGRLSEEKNIPFLLEAFAAVLEKRPDAHLVLAGGGPKEEALKRSAGKNVHFAGSLEPALLLDHYLAADLFVYTSITETQGLVLTEAKACGLPVVALFSGGLADVVENGVDGYLTPRRMDAFIEHVLRLVNDPRLREKMSLRAEEDAHARFSSLSVAKRVESVYNSLVNNAR